MLITIGIYTPLYSFSLFLPTIVKNMGYTNKESQLMSVPPYVFACICTIAAGYLADRTKQRGVFMISACLCSIIGFTMLISTHKPGVQYLGTFLAAGGIYPNVPMGVAWNGNNIGGSTKRGVGIAMHVGFGNLGGCIAAFAYRSTDAPRFFSGHGLLIATTSMSLSLCCFMTAYLRKENARRDALMVSQGLTLESYSDEMKDSERENGDNATVSSLVLVKAIESANTNNQNSSSVTLSKTLLRPVNLFLSHGFCFFHLLLNTSFFLIILNSSMVLFFPAFFILFLTFGKYLWESESHLCNACNCMNERERVAFFEGEKEGE